MTTQEIIAEIVNNGKADEVCRILFNMLLEDKKNLKKERQEYRASLVTIHKINKGKNEAIDALSEV